MHTILLMIQFFLAISLIVVILMQRSSSDGLSGLSGGSAKGGDSLFSSRMAGNMLTKTTAIIATLFIINSLMLAKLSGNQISGSVIEKYTEETPSETIDSTPTVPIAK